MLAAHRGRLSAKARALLTGDPSDAQREPVVDGSAGCAAAEVLAELAAASARAARLADGHQVAKARGIDQSAKNRLAALMAELTQAVVVCNLDGRILLATPARAAQFRACQAHAGGQRRRADRPGPLDPARCSSAALVARAGDVQQRQRRHGAPVGAVRHQHARRPAAARQWHWCARGRRAGAAALQRLRADADNITREFADESSARPRSCTASPRHRASLGNLQAAVEMLDDPDLDAEMRERFQAVIRDEGRR